MTIKTHLNNRRSTRIRLLGGAGLSPIERLMGRVMRAPDEHGGDGADAGAADGADGAAAAAPASALGEAAGAADDKSGDDGAAAADGKADDAGDGAAAGADGAAGGGGAASAGKATAGKEEEGEEAVGDTSIVGAPEAYDTEAFTMPEGVEFDTEMFDLVKDDLKGMDLSQKGAEAVVGIFASKVVPKIEERAVKAIDDAGAELRANLARDLQADPEVGGTKLKESQAYAAKAFAHFVPKAEERAQLSQFLNESGLGDHPLLTRVIAGAGRALSEASVPAGAGGTQERTAAEKFYGRKG